MKGDTINTLDLAEPSVSEALHARRSVRGFLPDPVSRETVERLLADASRSPSASNTQPWRVYACTGEERARLCSILTALHVAGGGGHAEEYPYYPSEWREPYLSRRRAVGKALYMHLGIPKGDEQRMSRQYARNYDFFGAPVGLFFSIERGMQQAAWLDLGMFLQGIMLAAIGAGLATCPQQAFARYHRVIRQLMNIPETEIVVCGMALGKPDPSEPANELRTLREPVSSFASFKGF
ncbi:nitroreductase [Paraburkholderia terrae]|uniref:nitroreductase n=1 Tax=Paraburkholderia terrae TaxID=311230 RepID=UPI0030E50061